MGDKPHNTVLYSDFNDLQRYLHNKDDTVIYYPCGYHSGTFPSHLYVHNSIWYHLLLPEGYLHFL